MGEALLAALRLRATLNARIRQFFAERDVLEVETPVLSRGGNTDPNIESFTTGVSRVGGAQRWLRTSSEFAQKRLLSAGVGDCYELGRVFRDGESGRRHNAEFSMLEWYRLGWDHHALMGEAVELVQDALALVDRHARVVKLSFREVFLGYVGFDPMIADVREMQNSLSAFQIQAVDISRDDWLDLVFTHRVQPALDSNTISLVYDYPASQCALAKIRDDAPPVAERFELYLGTLELANGYHELTGAVEQRKRFERDLAHRRERGLAAPALDEGLLAALQMGLPECAGVALGVDRLLMNLLGTDDIRDVLAFAFDAA